MVVRRATYPQVEPRAGELLTPAVTVVPRALTLAPAAALARRRRARFVVARVGSGWAAVTRTVLERALALDRRLGRAPLDAVLWGAPALPATTPEVTLRRRLGPATPLVIVLGSGGRPLGVVPRDAGARRALPRSAAEALGRLDPGTLELLHAAGRLGTEPGWPVAAVGGVVRDLLLGRLTAPPRDLDVAVEGDGRLAAGQLARALGGRVRRHDAFLTATVALADGRTVDVVTARREGYRRPGALPGVEPATLGEDLARRDFSVNALAVRLDGAAWGQVLDPTGGLSDLAARRLRVLHPLSFVEDPTRIFRAARFAVRLGFRLEPTTRRLLAAAARLPVYEALSGDRLMAELQAVLAEPAPDAVLVALARLGAFRLVLPGYRRSPAAERALTRVVEAARTGMLPRDAEVPLVLLALAAHLRGEAAQAWVARWGPPAPMRAAIAHARDGAPALARRLARAADAGAAHEALRGVPTLTAAWAHALARGSRVRRHVLDHLGTWRALPSLLTGEDLKALGLAPGPLFGRLLASLRTAQVAGRVRTRAEAEAWVRRALAGVSGGATGDATNGSGPDPKGGDGWRRSTSS
jgi:tRNA nucleotidyltransferase (CCA-adding enzyme)